VQLVTLSQRNLLALLHKLVMENSAGTIIKPGGITVHVEPDAVHYAGRSAPGPMHPDTERFIELMKGAIEQVKTRMMVGDMTAAYDACFVEDRQ
jgi:hypothetical protein